MNWCEMNKHSYDKWKSTKWGSFVTEDIGMTGMQALANHVLCLTQRRIQKLLFK